MVRRVDAEGETGVLDDAISRLWVFRSRRKILLKEMENLK